MSLSVDINQAQAGSLKFSNSLCSCRLCSSLLHTKLEPNSSDGNLIGNERVCVRGEVVGVTSADLVSFFDCRFRVWFPANALARVHPLLDAQLGSIVLRIQAPPPLPPQT